MPIAFTLMTASPILSQDLVLLQHGKGGASDCCQSHAGVLRFTQKQVRKMTRLSYNHDVLTI